MVKVYDGIIGVAIGDALGVPVEFIFREELAKFLVTGMQGYGVHNQPMGTCPPVFGWKRCKGRI